MKEMSNGKILRDLLWMYTCGELLVEAQFPNASLS